jgi:DNA-binding winged helix-turn-helix (wHTH) protein
MSNDRVTRHNELRKSLAELRESVIADLERRGYAVRGKTPAQIRQIIKRRASKQKPNAEALK